MLKVEKLRYLDRGPFSFCLEAGECVGLNGESGVGKSQLLRALTDLLPSQGTIELDGLNCAMCPAPEWRKLVTAEPVWWFDTVGEHFLQDGNLQKQLIERIALFELPLEVLRWQVQRLSTGEKQRLGMVRSLQNTPKVLLLDEPTSALGRRHTAIVEAFITTLRKTLGISVLWISHDPEQLVRVAERELHMDKDGLHETRSAREALGEIR